MHTALHRQWELPLAVAFIDTEKNNLC